MSAALDALDDAEYVRYLDLRDRTVRRALLTWERTPNLRNADVEILIPKLLTIVTSGDRTISSAARTNALRQLAALGYEVPTLAAIEAAAALPVLAADDVRSAVITVYDQLAKGKPFTDARAVGARRLEKIVRSHLSEVRLASAQRAYAKGGVKAFKRITRGSKTCELCTTAAENTYFVANLKPIHDDCDCGVRPARRDELDG